MRQIEETIKEILDIENTGLPLLPGDCMCGCGGFTAMSGRGDGKPRRFIVGHVAKLVVKRKCRICESEFMSRPVRRYCSDECLRIAIKRRPSSPKAPYLKYTKSCNSIGAAHEMIACADLLLYGLSVYRSQSPRAPFDMVAVHGIDKMWRVECTTGHISGKGTVLHAKVYDGTFDILAVVLHEDRTVRYFDCTGVSFDWKNVMPAAENEMPTGRNKPWRP